MDQLIGISTVTGQPEDIKSTGGALVVTNPDVDTDNIVSLKGNDGGATEYEAKVNSDGYLKVVQEGSNAEVLAETTVTFNEGSAIATLATAKQVAVPLPTNLQKDGYYQIEIYNPSTTTDIVVDAYNVSTYKSAEASPGVAAASRDVYVGTKTCAKQVITANVDTLPSCHILNVQGFCMGDSSKLLIKNATQIAAAQVQTMVLSGTLDSGTVEFKIRNAAGVEKSSLYAIPKQTATVANLGEGTFKLRINNASGTGTSSTAALAFDIIEADLETAINALLVTAGWLRSNTVGGTQITCDASGNFADGVILTFANTGTVPIDSLLLTATDITDADATITFAKTATTIAYDANAATLKASYDALLELAGWTTSAGAALAVTFSNALANNITITYAASVSTVVPVPIFTCSKAATTLTLRTTTFGATPVSVKVRKI